MIYEHFSILLYISSILYLAIVLSRLTPGKSTYETAFFKLILFFMLMLGAGVVTLYTEINIASPLILRRIFVATIVTVLFAMRETLQVFIASDLPTLKIKVVNITIYIATLFTLLSQPEHIAIIALVISLTWFLISIILLIKTFPKISKITRQSVYPFAFFAVLFSIAEVFFQSHFTRDYTLALPIISIFFTRMIFSLKSEFSDLNIQLSKQEQIIASHIKNGLSNKEIASKLFISEHTVKNHIYNIFKKMGVQNRVMLCNIMDKKDG